MRARVCVCKHVYVFVYTMNDIRSLARFTVCSWFSTRFYFISTFATFFMNTYVCMRAYLIVRMCVRNMNLCFACAQVLSLAYIVRLIRLQYAFTMYILHCLCMCMYQIFYYFLTVCLFLSRTSDFVIIKINAFWSHHSCTHSMIIYTNTTIIPIVNKHNQWHPKYRILSLDLAAISFFLKIEMTSTNAQEQSCWQWVCVRVLIGQCCSVLMCLINFCKYWTKFVCWSISFPYLSSFMFY